MRGSEHTSGSNHADYHQDGGTAKAKNGARRKWRRKQRNESTRHGDCINERQMVVLDRYIRLRVIETDRARLLTEQLYVETVTIKEAKSNQSRHLFGSFRQQAQPEEVELGGRFPRLDPC